MLHTESERMLINRTMKTIRSISNDVPFLRGEPLLLRPYVPLSNPFPTFLSADHSVIAKPTVFNLILLVGKSFKLLPLPLTTLIFIPLVLRPYTFCYQTPHFINYHRSVLCRADTFIPYP